MEIVFQGLVTIHVDVNPVMLVNFVMKKVKINFLTIHF